MSKNTNTNTNKPSKPSNVVSIQNGKDKWKALAAMPNARVIICNAPETYALADLARSADMSLNLMRKRLMVTIKPDVALPMMEKFNVKVIELEQVIAEICKMVNVRYQMPRNIVSVRKQMGLEVAEEGKKSQPAVTEEAEKGVSPKKAPKEQKAA